MTRNLKVLGLLLGAVFAIGAVMASTASAIDTFTVPAETADLTGTSVGNHVDTTTGFGLELHCQTVSYSGTVANGSKQVTLTPIYKGTKAEPANAKCESTLGKVTFEMNGCDYVFIGETTGSDEGKTDATMWIVCPAGKQIQITGPLGCTLSIHEQTPTSGGVIYTNENTVGPDDILVHVTLTGITYSSTEACGLVGIPSEGNTTDITETFTLKAYKDGSKHEPADQLNLTYSES